MLGVGEHRGCSAATVVKLGLRRLVCGCKVRVVGGEDEVLSGAPRALL